MKTKNNLDKQKVDELFKLKHSKNITNIEIAKALKLTHSTISVFFNKYVGSISMFNKIESYILLSEYKNIRIEQKKYGLIEIDNREKDIIIIANIQKNETNLIQIERENLKKLIDILKIG